MHIFFFLLLLMYSCADDESSVFQEMTPPPFPVYTGEIWVENQSQFDFVALYLHTQPLTNLESEENRLQIDLKVGERIQLIVGESQYITAFRPRVNRGPLWKIQSTDQVRFYHQPADEIPRLWLLDHGFLVIDSWSKIRE